MDFLLPTWRNYQEVAQLLPASIFSLSFQFPRKKSFTFPSLLPLPFSKCNVWNYLSSVPCLTVLLSSLRVLQSVNSDACAGTSQLFKLLAPTPPLLHSFTGSQASLLFHSPCSVLSAQRLPGCRALRPPAAAPGALLPNPMPPLSYYAPLSHAPLLSTPSYTLAYWSRTARRHIKYIFRTKGRHQRWDFIIFTIFSSFQINFFVFGIHLVNKWISNDLHLQYASDQFINLFEIF